MFASLFRVPGIFFGEVSPPPPTPSIGCRPAEDGLRQERMQNRMDKDRAEMLDRVDALTAALSSAAEERRRTVREMDDRAEAVRKWVYCILE